MLRFILSTLLILSTLYHGHSQKQLSSVEIYQEIQKLNFLGSALYVAAHPDDENTRMISHLSNGLHARTAYLSLTRGDGGQNLIGTEIRELLGVIRSQELQMARRVDGAQQFFTRANDFGYSKHPDETLRIWDKDKVMSDLIYTIREFKPDVIINRFDHRTPGKTHGHHTSSAMLSVEAFDLVNDKTIYPEHLQETSTWQPKRLFMNTSWWFYGSKEKFAKADKTNFVSVDAGEYYPSIGLSNSEISSLARSKHRSQGFGSAGGRGGYTEYLELIKGDLPENKEDLFDGINTTWTRIDNGEKLKELGQRLVDDFIFTDPSSSLTTLLQMYDELEKKKEGHWKAIKLEHLQELIIQCAGLFAEATIESQQIAHGDSIEIAIEATNRSTQEITLQSTTINGSTVTADGLLEPNTQNKWYHELLVDDKLSFSNPYWLDEAGQPGVYKVDEMQQRIRPESDPALICEMEFLVEERNVRITRPIIHRYVDPAVGEIRQPIAVTPEVTMKFDKEMYLFADDQKQKLVVTVRAGKDDLEGKLKLGFPSEWQVSPSSYDISIASRGLEKEYEFQISAPQTKSEATISAEVTTSGKTFDKSLTNIIYAHIPLQTVLAPAKAKLVKVPLKKGGDSIGYIMGAGDKMPESLSNVGYNVEQLSVSDLGKRTLTDFDALVIGIRAYNKVHDLHLYNEVLYDYAKAGGTLVVQYNTSRRLDYDHLSPYPIKLSRKRVTDEYAEMRMLALDHQVLNYPNKIEPSDFEGWVQERGLYFPEEWSSEFIPILSSNDKDEDPLDGSLLIATMGEGHFVYTSLSWFRQLPGGVPGAYRLFANIMALSDE